ncbi:MAG: class I SAM-dependent methyltransferase [Actinomycetota bacterium]|nr:class I SAM-dependent methyltransferase [Actinomycetota bacterium]
MQWSEIPGWFQWRSGQHDAVAHFPEGSRFLEVGTYLGRSLCSLAEVVQASGKQIAVIGVDTCLGSGPEGPQQKDYHGAAAAEGGGTFAGTLHRNILACGFGDLATVIIADSASAARMFADESLEWVHLDARHDYGSVVADIASWLPKVKPGGWLTGDDYDPVKWPEVIAAVAHSLPAAQPWSSQQWRWVVPVPSVVATSAAPGVRARATAVIRAWGRRLRAALRRRR